MLGDIIKIVNKSLYLIMKVEKIYEEKKFDMQCIHGVYLGTNVAHLSKFLNTSRDIMICGNEEIFLYENNDYPLLLSLLI